MNNNGFIELEAAVVIVVVSSFDDEDFSVEFSNLRSDHCARISPAIHKLRQRIAFDRIGRSST
jgi:hypothetical protein